MLEKSYFTCNNIFVWRKTSIIYQYSLSIVRWYVYWYSMVFNFLRIEARGYSVNRETHLVARENETERERKLKLRANRLQAGESEVGRVRTSLLKRSPW